ncbi:MAG TPA: 2-C-methyl-D-erythritol 4-phosphate cytidylyltransferase [Thermoanaerobaculia bacterium]|nr:2-C-methyl-D-erythritol 4-phosphate cytidylyltransferase [Thermoanaerobaculia bacterium]
MSSDPSSFRCDVILPAGGSGKRFGGNLPKQFADIGGRAMIEWTVERLVADARVERIVVAVGEAHRSRMISLISKNRWSRIELAEGGTNRQESVWNALQLTSGVWVAVHDAVRPNLTEALLSRIFAAAEAHGAAVPCLSLTETVHEVEDGRVVRSPSRESLRAAQTPQCFRRADLVNALGSAMRSGQIGTDEAAIVASSGYPVAVVGGDPLNFKVTFPEDFDRMATLLNRTIR